MSTCRPKLARSAVVAVAATVTAGVALAATPGEAEGVPFGADLNRPANNTVPCSINPVLGIPWVGLPLQQSCTWALAGNVTTLTETNQVPRGNGVLTAARVKVGPVTGPMQVVVYRALSAPDVNPPPPSGGVVCCTVQFVSPTFTPTPNSVTTVPLPAVPVVSDITPLPTPDPRDAVLRFDSIGLSVLSPNTPVPSHRTGNPNDLGTAFLPAFRAGEERLPGVNPSISGQVPLLNAEWVPIPPGSNISGPGNAGNAGSASEEQVNSVAAQSVCAGGQQTAERNPADKGATVESGPGGASLNQVKLSAGQLRINQAIGQAAVRRANAIEAWLNAGIEGRDICGGALPASKFGAGVALGTVPNAPAPTPPDPRPLEIGKSKKGSGGGKVKLTAGQLRTNQAIYAAAVRRANALEKRLDPSVEGGGLTGGNIKDGSLSPRDFAPGLGWIVAYPALEPPAPTESEPAPKSNKKGGAVKLTTGQLRTNQKIAQAAVRRTNGLIARIRSGLSTDNFRDGSITGGDLGSPS